MTRNDPLDELPVVIAECLVCRARGDSGLKFLCALEETCKTQHCTCEREAVSVLRNVPGTLPDMVDSQKE